MAKEEVTPAPTIDYTYVGGEKKKSNSKKRIRLLIPNQKMITGFILVILGVLAINALNFPISSFLSAKEGITANIGYPFTFLTIGMGQKSNLKIIFLLQDLLIYTFLAYIINIFLNIFSNLIGNLSNFKTKEVAEQKPTVYKDQKITTTDKIAEKISQ